MQRVLIVEPDGGLRRDLAEGARAAGWEVEEARHVREAQQRIARVGFDGILIDLAEPQDLQHLEMLRRHAPHAVLIAMGARPSFEIAVGAMKHGARDFLRKPFAIGAFESALASALPSPASGRPAVELLTRDPGMERLLREARGAAASEATVQIVGESGTGKDLLARYIHLHSGRRVGPLVGVNCAALPEGLAETELFGHERGAFTGAHESRPGQIAAAHGGTLLLDQVSELSPALQPKLLRVLQEREVLPVGGLSTRPVDVRILATTQRDLGAEVKAGRFRADLYYRLDVIVLRVPPLRDRPADIPYLAQHFLERLSESQGVETPRLSARGRSRLGEHTFPGNVRELENLMRRAVVLFPGREVDVERLFGRRATPVAPPRNGSASLNLRELERQTIIRSLSEFDGNRTLAARALGISVRTLRNKIHLYGLA